MEGHDDVPTDNHEVANTDESDTRNVSVTESHLATDSTVNVRNSASSIQPESSVLHKAEAFIEPFPEEGLLSAQQEPATSDGVTEAHQHKAIDMDEQTIPEETMQLRHSSRSMGSLEEGDQSTITLRSRSDSSGTFSSSDGSAQVDWDELEREEDQAPRDEGSDEASVPPTPQEEALTLTRPAVDRFSSS